MFASTVKLINDDQLEKLGIATVGDRASLRQMCEQNAQSELYKFKGQVYNWRSSLPRVRIIIFPHLVLPYTPVIQNIVLLFCHHGLKLF